jgi:HEAT repeat protein
MRRTFGCVALILGCGAAGCAPQANQTWSTKAAGSNLGAFERAPTRDAAIAVLEEAAASDHPLLRANAIEALQAAPERVEDFARRGLADTNLGVRFAAAMTIGELRLAESAYLVEPLLHDESESVRAAAMFALKRCGREVDLTPLAELLRGPDVDTRANVAMILGELGEPSSAPLLEQAAARGGDLANPAQLKIAELQLAEALVQVGRTEQVHSIRAALFLPEGQQEVAALACLMAGRLGDQGSVGSLWRLVNADGLDRRPAEVRMAAAHSLGRLGEPVSADIVRDYVRHERPEIRAQAAATLGSIGGPRALAMLGPLVNDPNPLVAVAAASSILQLDRRSGM